MLKLVKRDDANTCTYKTTINGQHMYSMAFTSISKEGLTNAQIEKIATQISKNEYKKGIRGTCQVSADYNIGWRNGHSTKIGANTEAFDPVNFPEYQERDVEFDFDQLATRFIIIFCPGLKLPSDKGGAGSYNDCLFDALHERLGGKLPKKINTAPKLKEACGVERRAKLGVEHIKILEVILEDIGINVIGDVMHLCDHECKIIVNLCLIKGHYYLSTSKKTLPQTKGTFFTPKPVELLRTYSLGEVISIYDGKTITTIPPKDFTALRKLYKFLFIKMARDETLESTYDNYIIMQKQMMETSGGKIDMFKYDLISKASMDIWTMHTGLKLPETIDDIEGDWLDKTFSAGLRYSKVGYTGPYHLYDINSQYPAIMIHPKFQVPIKQGCYMKLTELPSYFKYGMYRCQVMPSDDENVNKLFKFNNKDFYTHYDLTLAKKMNMAMKLYDGVNFYYYERKECLEYGVKIFGDFVNELYEYKKAYSPFKKIMNTLYGALCQRDRKTKYVNITQENNIELDTLHDMNLSGKMLTVEYSKAGAKPFLHSYARFGIYITSFARFQFVNEILRTKCAPLIVRIHTDSIMTTVPLPLKLSDDIGGWKHEKSGECNIINGVRYNDIE